MLREYGLCPARKIVSAAHSSVSAAGILRFIKSRTPGASCFRFRQNRRNGGIAPLRWFFIVERFSGSLRLPVFCRKGMVSHGKKNQN